MEANISRLTMAANISPQLSEAQNTLNFTYIGTHTKARLLFKLRAHRQGIEEGKQFLDRHSWRRLSMAFICIQRVVSATIITLRFLISRTCNTYYASILLCEEFADLVVTINIALQLTV